MSNMKSVLNGINKEDATVLLGALKDYANAYYTYKDGTDYDPYADVDKLNHVMHELTVKLAFKIGLVEED